jgi:predicted acyltransferase
MQNRLVSLDAFRGYTMIWMFSQSFGLHLYKDDAVLGPVARQFTHHEWHGTFAWDLIQPFFMFIVGVAMPYAFAAREAAGQTWPAQFRHVLKRCALLIALGLLARSLRANRPVLDLINVLAQIAFTYFVAFLVLQRSARAQAGTALGLLAVHTALFVVCKPEGAATPWEAGNNFGSWLDMAVLGKNWGGGYATLNGLSSAANTIFGVMAGNLLRREKDPIRPLLVYGAVCLAAGLALDPVLPSIKKIWTASFALLSNGWTLWTLAGFYWLCDVKQWQRWARPGIIVGANSIFIYVFHEIMEKWLNQSARVLFGWSVAWWGTFGEMFIIWMVVLFQIWVCYWLYHRKIFFKV